MVSKIIIFKMNQTSVLKHSNAGWWIFTNNVQITVKYKYYSRGWEYVNTWIEELRIT